MQASKPTIRRRKTSAAGSENRAAITIDDYNEILSGIELQDIYLNDTSCEAFDRAAFIESFDHLEANLTTACRYEHLSGPKEIVRVSQVVGLFYGSQEAPLLIMYAEFKLDYKSEHKWNDSFFDRFKVGPLFLQVVPYLREFIHQMSVRMKLPPIILPLAKLTFGSDDDQISRI